MATKRRSTKAISTAAAPKARSSALDELLESGVLEDVGGGSDDIQRELDQLGAASSVDQDLAALQASMPPMGALGPGTPAEQEKTS